VGMKTFRNRRSLAIVWVMVALTLVGGMPREGCVCANGQHKIFCGKQFAKACCQKNGPTKSGRCSCCHQAEVAANSSSSACADASTDGCPNRDRHAPSETSVSNKCCTRYTVSPVVPTVEKIVAAPNSLSEWAVLDFVPNLVTFSVAVSGRELGRNPDLPVPDLVIAHQVFLI
jgi:hypothetical protein